MADREALVRSWFDAWNARDFGALAEMYTADAEYVRSDGKSHGIDEIIGYLKDIAAAFPDESATIQAILVAPDGVTVEWLEDATHLAPRATSMGVIPATNRGFKNERIVTVVRFDGDKISSQREYYDLFSMMRQLGWMEFFAKAAAASATSTPA